MHIRQRARNETMLMQSIKVDGLPKNDLQAILTKTCWKVVTS